MQMEDKASKGNDAKGFCELEMGHKVFDTIWFAIIAYSDALR